MLAREGAKVAVTDINYKGAQAVAAAINEKHKGAAVAISQSCRSPGVSFWTASVLW